MIEKYTLDMLTQDSVSVKIQKFTRIDGEEYEIGQPHRVAYMNTITDREQIINELPEPQKNAIFAVWGSEPTIE